MKALLINGSPRPNGCTFTALTELANTLEAEGIETEIVHVGNKDIRGCIACRRCHSTGSNKCVFDDIVNEVAPKLAEADAFVIGAPVYFGSPAGGAISFMDRLFFSTLNIDKTMKVGASVVTCRRGGNRDHLDACRFPRGDIFARVACTGGHNGHALFHHDLGKLICLRMHEHDVHAEGLVGKLLALSYLASKVVDGSGTACDDACASCV